MEDIRSPPMNEITTNEHEDTNSDSFHELQNNLSNIQHIREKKFLKPNWPSFFPLIHYNPSELCYPFDFLVNRSFRYFLSVIISFFYNIFTLTQIDLSCFSFNRALFLSVIQGFAAIYFCYAFSFRYLYCSSIVRHVPYRFVFYQFGLIFWNIYILIGFCQTGFAGLSTLFNAVFENGEDDTFSILIIAFNCIIFAISLVLNCLTLSAASYARFNPSSNNSTKRKINNSRISML